MPPVTVILVVLVLLGAGLLVSLLVWLDRREKQRRKKEEWAAGRRVETEQLRARRRRSKSHKGQRRKSRGPGPPLGPWLRRNGWWFDGVAYHGWFHTSLGAWQGRVEYRDGSFEVYVIEPPDWIFHGRDGGCVRDKGNKVFWIHQDHYQPGVRETIRATEAFFLRQAQQAGAKRCIPGESRRR